MEQVELFDVYVGDKIGAGKKSVAFSISLRSQEGTLTDEEVDRVMKKILRALEAEFQAKLRD